jgi:hypothetical protein
MNQTTKFIYYLDVLYGLGNLDSTNSGFPAKLFGDESLLLCTGHLSLN